MRATLKMAGKFALRHWLAVIMLVAPIVLLMSPHMLERFYIYYPTRDVAGDPSMLGLEFQDITEQVTAGQLLQGLLFFLGSGGVNDLGIRAVYQS